MQVLARGIRRFLLRFLLFYWLCFTFPFPLALVGLPFQFIEPDAQPTWMKAAGEYYGSVYSWIYKKEGDACKWVGANILKVEVIVQSTGSGDTMRGYVGCLCATGIAATGALLWTAFVLFLPRWKPAWQPDAFLHRFVRVQVRFYLAAMLFGYGFAKVFPFQFAQPSSFRLTQQLGDMSPMGLLWTFMGFSTPYQMFTGSVEVLGGLLLLTRRTTLLGALITIVAMTQIFALNMSFDVPVKLYSFHYLLMALFLAAPELPRLFNVLILNRSVEAKPFTPMLGSIRFDRFAVVLRTLVVADMLYGQIHFSHKTWNSMYGGPPAPLTGRWDVVEVQIDKKDAGKNDPATWSWLDFSNKSLRLASLKPPAAVYRVTWNPDEKKLTLGKFADPTWSATFTYNFAESDKLKLQGSMDSKEITATLKPAPEKHYELMNRGFRWIQEVPYNR
jgi:hypothetical protein